MVDRTLRLASVLGTVALISACGGDAFVSDGGSGGTASNGGAGSGASGGSSNGGTATGGDGGSAASGGSAGSSGSAAGGSSSGGSGGTRQCPEQRPDGACDVPGLECSYGEAGCCQDTATCEGGVWVTNPCPQVSCPLAPPAHGTDCTCLEGRQCTYDCTNSVVSTEASCTNSGSWAIQTRPCPGPCGGEVCMIGQVCVTKVKENMVDSQYCTQTSCTGQLTCQCAGDLCGVGYECTDVENLGLICTAK